MVGASSTQRTSRRTRQRQALSCTECTRRKLRCSKSIPCTACKDRDQTELCHRRHEPAPSKRTESLQMLPFERLNDDDHIEAQLSPLASPSWRFAGHDQTHQREANRSTMPPISDTENNSSTRLIDDIAPDAPVTLEFLAQSRSRMLRLGRDTLEPPGSSTVPAESSADPLLTIEQARLLVEYHCHYVNWIHNVVHLPTFRQDCEKFLLCKAVPESCWPSMYYAMLSVTFYHISADALAEIGLSDKDNLALKTYHLSLDALDKSDYTANHQMSAVQAVCLLIYIGHNIGQSDRICVLLASVTRIAQCLGMHRLGDDYSQHLEAQCDRTRTESLIQREIRKRVWWFLIRQDWLQIPYANTYSIHPSQFNTPMPTNCFDEVHKMVVDNEIQTQPRDVFTHGSFTAVLNQVSVIIWQTQDRMLSAGHPGESRQRLHELYEVVLRADEELKGLVRTLPKFFGLDAWPIDTPSCVQQQAQVLRLTLAHKFYSIHRHFQVVSFKDPWFSYTRVSCVAISLQGLRNMFTLPDEEATHVVRNLWTVNSQITTAATWVIFELLFAREGDTRTNSDAELQNIVRSAIDFLRFVHTRSCIAKNGIRVLELLLDASERVGNRGQPTIDIDPIIADIKRGAAQGGTVADDGGAADAGPMGVEDWVGMGNIDLNFHDGIGVNSIFDLFSEEPPMPSWSR